MARTRRETYRNTDPTLKERDARWASEAKHFARQQIKQIFKEPGDYLTVGEILARLDTHPMPPVGYVRYLDSSAYKKRYQLVRMEAEKLYREGLLEAGTTVNSKGREDVICYRRAQPKPRFSVEIEPKMPDIQKAFQRWIEENVDSLRGLDTVLITRVNGLTKSQGGDDHENGQTEAGAGAPHEGREAAHRGGQQAA